MRFRERGIFISSSSDFGMKKGGKIIQAEGAAAKKCEFWEREGRDEEGGGNGSG